MKGPRTDTCTQSYNLIPQCIALYYCLTAIVPPVTVPTPSMTPPNPPSASNPTIQNSPSPNSPS